MVVMLVGSTYESVAQTQKFGYVNSLELLSIMPEVKSADAQLAGLENQFATRLQSYQQEYQTKYLEVQKMGGEMSEAILEQELKSLQQIETKIMEVQQGAQTEFATKKQELFAPIFEKASNMVKTVADENGFSYIFDSASGNGLLHAPPGDDLLPLIKAKYGL